MRATLARSSAAAGVLLLAVIGALVIASSASASSCGKRVVADWYDNGRIDGVYDLHCYDEAIASIPNEIRDYVDAEDVIGRAFQEAARARGISPTRSIQRTSRTPEHLSGGATRTVDTSAPSAVPLPLVVLGAMSLALMAAGGLGYLSRRGRGGRDDLDQA